MSDCLSTVLSVDQGRYETTEELGDRDKLAFNG